MMIKAIKFPGSDGHGLSMDLFLPEGWKHGDRRGLIAFFFGGWWMGGTTKQFWPQASELSRLGMVAAIPAYRTFKQSGTPVEAAVSDAMSAMSFLLGHAEEFGADPDKIAVAGGSAGGHLALSTLLLKKWMPKEDFLLKHVKAAALWNPVLDVAGIKKPNEALINSRFPQVDLSPFHHMRAGLPDTILFHGTNDTTVPIETARRFAEVSRQLGNICELLEYPGREHGFFNLAPGKIIDYYHTLGCLVKFLYERDFFERI